MDTEIGKDEQGEMKSREAGSAQGEECQSWREVETSGNLRGNGGREIGIGRRLSVSGWCSWARRGEGEGQNFRSRQGEVWRCWGRGIREGGMRRKGRTRWKCWGGEFWERKFLQDHLADR